MTYGLYLINYWKNMKIKWFEPTLFKLSSFLQSFLQKKVSQNPNLINIDEFAFGPSGTHMMFRIRHVHVLPAHRPPVPIPSHNLIKVCIDDGCWGRSYMG